MAASNPEKLAEQQITVVKTRLTGTLYSLPHERAADRDDVVQLSRGLMDFLIHDWSKRPVPSAWGTDHARISARLLAELVDRAGIPEVWASTFVDMRLDNNGLGE